MRTISKKANEELFEKSVDTWTDLSTALLDGVSKSGYAPCGAMCLYAQIGKTERLDSLMNVFLYGRSSRGPNAWASTMYREFGPVIETPLFFAASLQELFLQSNGNEVKVFPAVSGCMGDITIHRYRTEGGFEISAKYVEGKTAFIEVKSLNGNDLILKSNMENMGTNRQEEVVSQIEKNRYQVQLAMRKHTFI
ncbi:MAG: hypothetical protein HRT61_23570 [Ekhidna sp.]|nr:hypothetical protein [Ekhidna sp.]